MKIIVIITTTRMMKTTTGNGISSDYSLDRTEALSSYNSPVRIYRNKSHLFCLTSLCLGVFLLGSLLCPITSAASTDKRLCLQSEDGQEAVAIDCYSNFCFALWRSINGSEDVEFVTQGCWESSPTTACLQSECITNKTIYGTDKRSTNPEKEKPNFCCCSDEFCNSNVSVTEVFEEEEDEEDFNRDHEYAEISAPISPFRTHITALIVSITIVCMFLASIITVFLCKSRRKCKPNQQDDTEAGAKLMEPIFQEVISWELTDPIILGDEIAKGKYATVCSGSMGGQEIAIKCFAADQKDVFENEKSIFQILGRIIRPHIVKYYGWQEFTVNSSPNLILAMERIKPGTLRDFLIASEHNTLEFNAVMKIMRGITSGLSYLHGENKEKFVVVHRDLISKNILIDQDLNVRISDFGLSLLTKGSKYYYAGRERQAEFCSLAEAGTLRYMAPELLEGAVNLKDCESALKQADIYALALIIWEVANLSHDIALPPCIHRLPYEQEIGKDICIESLARYVVTRRDRPVFTGWRDSPLSRGIRDTLNESWDPEPDARLTAVCIVERLVELHHSKNTACDSTTPLEALSPSPWQGRNPCLSRNLLLEENSEGKSTEYLLTSEKHLIPNGPTNNSRITFMGGISSGSESYSTAGTTISTISTDLSSGYTQSHPLNLPVPPNPIPFVRNVQNIRR